MKITAAVIAHNAQGTIRDALLSLGTQTYPASEILVIDDGSTDATTHVVSELADLGQLPQVRLYSLEENRGVAGARQEALDRARHPWMVFLDADDIALPHMLTRQAEAISRSQEGVVGVGVYGRHLGAGARYIPNTPSKGRCIRLGPTSHEALQDALKSGRLVFMLAPVLFQTARARSAGGYRNLRCDGLPGLSNVLEDVDLWTRMAERLTPNERMFTIPEPLFLRRRLGSSVTAGSTYISELKYRWLKQEAIDRRAGRSSSGICQFVANLNDEQIRGIRRRAAVNRELILAALAQDSANPFRAAKHLVRAGVTDPRYVLERLL